MCFEIEDCKNESALIFVHIILMRKAFEQTFVSYIKERMERSHPTTADTCAVITNFSKMEKSKLNDS